MFKSEAQSGLMFRREFRNFTLLLCGNETINTDLSCTPVGMFRIKCLIRHKLSGKHCPKLVLSRLIAHWGRNGRLKVYRRRLGNFNPPNWLLQEWADLLFQAAATRTNPSDQYINFPRNDTIGWHISFQHLWSVSYVLLIWVNDLVLMG